MSPGPLQALDFQEEDLAFRLAKTPLPKTTVLTLTDTPHPDMIKDLIDQYLDSLAAGSGVGRANGSGAPMGQVPPHF